MINRVINLQMAPEAIIDEYVADASKFKTIPALHLANCS